MREGRMVQMMQRLESFYASISYKLEIGSESDFRNAMYIMYMLMGEQVEAEYDTSDGRIDLLVRTDRFVYIIECKINSTARVALQQIHDKEYDLPWRIENREKVLIGLNFSTEKRRPDDWVVERGDGTILSRDAQNDTQDDTEGDTQGDTKGKNLDKWILAQIRKNPKVTTELLAQMSGRGVATIKRHTSKMPNLYFDGSGYSGKWVILDEPTEKD